MVVTQLEATMNIMAVKYVPEMKILWRKICQIHRQMIYRHCKDKCTVSCECILPALALFIKSSHFESVLGDLEKFFAKHRT